MKGTSPAIPRCDYSPHHSASPCIRAQSNKKTRASHPRVTESELRPVCDQPFPEPRPDGPARSSERANQSCFLSNGNAMTSRMLGEFVSSMTSRSTPSPMPAVGGMPYSSAVTKSSSNSIG